MNNKKSIYSQGIIVAAILGVLTLAEYFIATGMSGATLLLVAVAVVKGALVAWYFMHIYSLWTEEESH